MSNRTLSFAVIAISLAALFTASAQAQTGGNPDSAKQSASQTAEQEKVWLGVAVKTLTRGDLFNSARRIPIGVQVLKVFEDSPAAGSLLRGDMLLTMDGNKIPNASALFSRLAKKKPGTKVVFGVKRGRRTGEVTVKLDTRTLDNGSHTTTANSSPVPPSPSPQRQAAAEAKKPEPAPQAKPETKHEAAPDKPVTAAKPKPQQAAKAAPATPAPSAIPAPPVSTTQTNTPQKTETPSAPSPAPSIAVAQTDAPQPEAPKSEAPKTEAAAPSPAPSSVVAQAGTPNPVPAKLQKPAKTEPPIEPAAYSSACDGIGVYVGILPTKTKKLCLKPGGGEKAGQSFRDCPECPEMVVIPSGSFMMGSPKTEVDKDGDHSDKESPQHKVTIAKTFAVGKYEISFDEWQACVADGSCPETRKSDFAKWGRGQRPVIYVKWNATKAYVKWLNQKTGQSYRLLTEAEWEYAARAGTKTRYWWGDKIKSTQANFSYDVEHNGVKQYRGEPNGIIREKTLPVGEFKPNPWGLYDVHGNVWEWVEDCWHRTYKDKPEELKKTGAAWKVGDCFHRVQRGGAWKSTRYYTRSASRGYDEFDHGDDYDVGFRIARDLQKKSKNN